MTNREFFEAIINANINEALTDKAKEELAKLDHRNSVRADAKLIKREAEYLPLEEKIFEAITEYGEMSTSEIAKCLDLTTAKVSPRCKALVEKGRLMEKEHKIPKVGVRKFYSTI